MTHLLHTPIRALTLALAVLATGCSSTTPRLDAVFGQAVREARAAQTLYPQASANTEPVLGMDGQAAAAAQQRYQASFVTPPQSFEVGNIGGGISGN
jgi:hypothetical protein